MAKNLILFSYPRITLDNRLLVVVEVFLVSSNASATRVFIFLNALRVGKRTARVTLSVVQTLALKYPSRCVNHEELDYLPLFHSALPSPFWDPAKG